MIFSVSETPVKTLNLLSSTISQKYNKKFNGGGNSGTTHLNNHYNKIHNNIRGQTELNLNNIRFNIRNNSVFVFVSDIIRTVFVSV